MWKKIAVLIIASSFSSIALADKPDGWVTTKTKLALWTTSGIDSTSIDVDTIDGAVTLHGRVESETAKQKAEQEARKIDGVKSVRNLLVVVPEANEKAVKKSDKEIERAVKDAFKADAFLAKSDMNVRAVTDGLVIIGGKTDDIGHEWHAVRVARDVPGVHRVACEVKLPEGEHYAEADTMRSARAKVSRTGSDSWITTDVKMRLIADGDVPAMSINVDTRDGTVKLFGMVPNDDAKRAAEKDAMKVDGVQHVENDLKIVPSSEMKVAKADDKDVQKEVKRNFDKTEGLSGVSVDVKGGVVHLTGNVSSRAKVLRASIVARSTPGARAVSNDLEVKHKND